MKCVKCGSLLESERDKCPKCATYTTITFTGKVKEQPKLLTNGAGENYVYFSTDTGQQEVYCEIKQGYEVELPLAKGDEILLEGRAFLEGTQRSFRITQLVNKTASQKITYQSSGCLLNLIYLGGLIVVAALYI